MDFLYHIDNTLSVNLNTIKFIEVFKVSGDKAEYPRQYQLVVHFKDGTFKQLSELHSEEFAENLFTKMHNCTKQMNFK